MRLKICKREEISEKESNKRGVKELRTTDKNTEKKIERE